MLELVSYLYTIRTSHHATLAPAATSFPFAPDGPVWATNAVRGPLRGPFTNSSPSTRPVLGLADSPGRSWPALGYELPSIMASSHAARSESRGHFAGRLPPISLPHSNPIPGSRLISVRKYPTSHSQILPFHDDFHPRTHTPMLNWPKMSTPRMGPSNTPQNEMVDDGSLDLSIQVIRPQGSPGSDKHSTLPSLSLSLSDRGGKCFAILCMVRLSGRWLKCGAP